MIARVRRLKFTLTSDQLELLLAFESAQGLTQLSELMARDASVVSRNLQRLAEDAPVLKKVKGRWEITPLGMRVNEQTRTYLEQQSLLLTPVKRVTAPLFSDGSVLIVVNAQNGLLDATQEGRNNSQAEANISQILRHWRASGRRTVHVKHVSDRPDSVFYRKTTGCDFLAALAPSGTEVIVEKSKSSAFAGTQLEAVLNAQACTDIVLVGFTANECIEATARDAATLGFAAAVVGDATATFDMRDPAGKWMKADRIHRLTMTNIHAFYAKVVNTADVLSRPEVERGTPT